MSHPSSSAERFERRLPRSLGRDSRTDRCPVQPSWEKPRIRPAGCSPLPRRHTAAESGAIATAMLGPLDLGVHIVVAEIPFLVGPDRPLAARADRSFTRCDPACPPTLTLPMLRPVGLAVAGVLQRVVSTEKSRPHRVDRQGAMGEPRPLFPGERCSGRERTFPALPGRRTESGLGLPKRLRAR
jgi:hypothetical protein